MFRALLITILFQCSAVAEETRILFVGNSYTGQVRKTVSSFIKASPEGSTTHMEFVTPGGRNLESHLQNKATIFEKSPEPISYKGGLSDEDAATILEAVRKTTDSDRWKTSNAYPVNRALTNSEGTKIQAQIKGRSKSKVHFNAGGKSFIFDISQLSEADQAYLNTLPVNR